MDRTVDLIDPNASSITTGRYQLIWDDAGGAIVCPARSLLLRSLPVVRTATYLELACVVSVLRRNDLVP